MKDEEIDNSNTIDLTETHSIGALWKKLKNSIFDVLFVLLNNSQEDQSMIGLSFETGVDYLQMMAFPFSASVIAVWSSGETIQGIQQIVEKINISTYLPGIGFGTFLILLYALIFLIITVIIDILYVIYSFSKKKFKFTWPLVYLAKIVPLIVTVMFLPIMETLLEVVNCAGSQNGNYQVMVTFPQIKCWQGWHLAHSAITLLFSSIFVFISCIVTLTVFQPRMTTNRLTSRQNSEGQVIFIINKIICQFIFSFSPFESSLPYSLLLFVLSGWLYSAYNIKQPYYSKIANKFFRILSTYYFWTNFMLLVSQLLRPLNFQHGLVIWICGMAFIGLTILFERKTNIDKLFSSSLKFKSGQQLEHHLQYVLQLHHNRNDDNNSYMLLLGYIQKHIEICLEDDCPLRIKKYGTKQQHKNNGKQQQEFSCKMLLKQIQKMFLFGVKKYPNCTKLRLTFAFFYMQKLNNKIKAYQHFTKAINTNPSFGEQFIIYRFRKIITQKLEQKQQDNKADLIDLIRLDNYVSLCEEGMFISGKLHKQFWIQLLEESPNLIRLNKIGAKITETFMIISKNYDQVFKGTVDHTKLCQLQYNYALYLLFVIQNIQLGKKQLELAKKNFRIKKLKILELQQLNSINSRNPQQEHSHSYESNNVLEEIQATQQKCILIVQSGEQTSNVCRIMKVNNKFLELVKYQYKQLISSKLETILPALLSTSHDEAIHRWLNRKQSSSQTTKQYFDKKNIGYIRDSANFIRKVNYKVKYFSMQKCFFTEIQVIPNQQKQAYLMIDIQGNITDRNYQFLYRFRGYEDELQIKNIIPEQSLQRISKLTWQIKTFKMNINFPILSKTYYSCIQLFSMTKQKKKPINKSKNKLSIQNLNQESLIQVASLNIQEQNKQVLGMVFAFSENTHSAGNNFQFLQNIINKNQITMNISDNIYHQVKFLIKSHYTSSINSQNSMKALFGFLKRKGTGNSWLSQMQQKKKNYAQYLDEENNIMEIKVFRFFKNKFKRIYYDDLLEQEEKSDYDYQQKNTDIQAKLSKQKINDQVYQTRVRKAINTYFYHPEIITMIYIGLTLLTIFIATNLIAYHQFLTNVIDKSTNHISDLNSTIHTTSIIAQRLLHIMFYDPNQQSIQELKSALSYDDPIVHYKYFTNNYTEVTHFQLEDGNMIKLDIQNCFFRIDGNILRYLQELSSDTGTLRTLSQSMQISYHNYIAILFESIEQNYVLDNYVQEVQIIFIICIAVSFVFSLVFIGGWIYNSLKIRHKIFQILIWFLDIPMDYLTFAYKKCLYFNKSYMESKKLIEKQVEIDSCQHYIQQFAEKNHHINIMAEVAPNNQSCQENQQNKSRQILISRYRKQGLLQKLQCKQLHKLWVIVIINIYLFTLKFVKDYIIQETDIICLSENFYARQLLWLDSMVMVDQITRLKAINNTSWDLFTQQKLIDIPKQILSNFEKITKKQKGGLFAKIAKQLITKQDQITEEFVSFQYEDICVGLSSPDLEECQHLLNNLLREGFSVTKQKIIDFHKGTMIEEEIIQLKIAVRKYISPAMKRMLIKWFDISINKIYGLKKTMQIILAIYLVAGITLLLFFWNLYLRSWNLNLSQTIKILNMIPIDLFPVVRQQVRDFIKWIILMAGQQGEETQDKQQSL